MRVAAAALSVGLPALLIALFAALLATPIAAQAQMAPIASYGEWTVNCEAGSFARRCVINASDEAWREAGGREAGGGAGGEAKIGVVYYPAQRILNVVVAERSFVAQARIDRGPDQAGDCLPQICGFARNDFGAALEKGTVLFVTVSGADQRSLTFAKNLLDLRQAVAAAKAWMAQKQ